MPPGRYAPAYTPSEEELAALEAELTAQEAVPSPGLGGGSYEAPPPPPPTQTAQPLAEPVPPPPSTEQQLQAQLDAPMGTTAAASPVAPVPPPPSGAPSGSYATEPVGGNDTYYATTPTGATLRAGASGTSGAPLTPYDSTQPPPTPGLPRGGGAASDYRPLTPERVNDSGAITLPAPNVDVGRGPLDRFLQGADAKAAPNSGLDVDRFYRDRDARRAAEAVSPPRGERGPLAPLSTARGAALNPTLMRPTTGEYTPYQPMRPADPYIPPPRDNPPGPLARDPAQSAEASGDLARQRASAAGSDVDGRTILDQALGNLLPGVAGSLGRAYGWGNQLEQSVRGGQDVLGGMVLDEPAKPGTPAGQQGRAAGQTVDPLIDAAAENLVRLGRWGIGQTANLSPGRSGRVGLPPAPASIAMPEPPPPDLVSQRLQVPAPGQRTEASAVPTPDAALPVVDFLEDVVAPRLPWNQRGAGPASTSRQGNDPLAQVFAEEAGGAPATTGTQAAGEQTIPRNVGGTLVDVIWQGETPVGILDPETGERIALTPKMTQEEVDALFADVVARTPATPAPSSPTTPYPAAATAPASVPAPTTTGTSSPATTSGDSGEWVDYSSDDSGARGGSRSEGRSQGSSDFDDFFADFGGGREREREFTAEDFLDAADGDRKRATAMAKAANKKRRKKGKLGKSSTSSMGKGFPFDRPPTPLRTSILAALGESMGKGRKA